MTKHLSSPTEVFLGITNLCNSACRHCNISTLRYTANTSGDMTTAEWIKCIEELAALKVFEVTISGGEPFMRDDLFTIMDKIESLPIRMHLNTNATLIDKAKAKKLSEYKKLSGVMISLDGASSQVHDQLRGKGMFSKALAGIKSLLSAGVNVSFYCTVTKYNFNDLENIAGLVYEIGPRSIKFNLIAPHARNFAAFLKILPARLELDESFNQIKKLHNKYGGMIDGTLLQMIEIFDAIEKVHSMGLTSPNRANTFIGCKTLITKCTIRPDGFVTPCDRLWELTAGNVREKSLGEIWHNSIVFKDFRRRFSMTLDAVPECRNCEYKYYCLGGCPVMPYYLYNKLISFDPISCYKIYKEKREIHDYIPSSLSIK